MPTVTSRVVANIYRGINFPIGWADKPNTIDFGMVRDLLVSVAVMFDADLKPIALCWGVDGRDERFMHAQLNDPDNGSLLDELNRDLTDESSRLGAADLFATMIWAPEEIRPDQGQFVRRIPFLQGRFGPITGWNIATRTLVAKSGNLLFMTRRIDQDLELSMPTSIGEMHREMDRETDSGNWRTLIVMPGKTAVATEKSVGKRMAFLFCGLIALSALITAYLMNK